MLAGKQEDAARREALTERVKALKAGRSAMGDKGNASREARVARNRGVLRAHERLARLQSKARGDDRAQRLEALKVDLLSIAAAIARAVHFPRHVHAVSWKVHAGRLQAHAQAVHALEDASSVLAAPAIERFFQRRQTRLSAGLFIHVGHMRCRRMTLRRTRSCCSGRRAVQRLVSATKPSPSSCPRRRNTCTS